MQNFLKENWFKIIIAFVLVIIALSIAYYFVIYLTQQKQLSILENNKKTNLENQQNCAEQAAKAFKAANFTAQQSAGYVNHYNQRLNKCFIEFTEMDSYGISMSLSDANELTEYAYLINLPKGSNLPPHIQCSVDEQSGSPKTCNSRDEFDNYVKPFMEN